jgi:hypothetical protein
VGVRARRTTATTKAARRAARAHGGVGRRAGSRAGRARRRRRHHTLPNDASSYTRPHAHAPPTRAEREGSTQRPAAPPQRRGAARRGPRPKNWPRASSHGVRNGYR